MRELSERDLRRILATVKIAEAVHRETARLGLSEQERDWLGHVVADAVRDGLREIRRRNGLAALMVDVAGSRGFQP